MKYSLSALFLVISAAAVLSLWASPESSTYVHTGRPSDITVIGNGWLRGTDLNSNKRAYFKSCRLSINQFSALVGSIGDRKLAIEPAVSVMDGSIDNLRCSPDGKITVLFGDSPAPVYFGQLDLALAQGSGKSWVLGEDELVSAPVMSLPNSTTGYLQSGWLLQQETLVDRIRKVSCGEIAILVAVCAAGWLGLRRGGPEKVSGTNGDQEKVSDQEKASGTNGT